MSADEWNGASWDIDDLDKLIPLRPVGSIAYAPDENDSCLWDVSVTHDADGHGVGITVVDSQLVLTCEEASRMGIGLIQAAAMAVAWDCVRAKAN